MMSNEEGRNSRNQSSVVQSSFAATTSNNHQSRTHTHTHAHTPLNVSCCHVTLLCFHTLLWIDFPFRCLALLGRCVFPTTLHQIKQFVSDIDTNTTTDNTSHTHSNESDNREKEKGENDTLQAQSHCEAHSSRVCHDVRRTITEKRREEERLMSMS